MITGKCMVCNGELVHYEAPVIAKCSECGAREKTYILCKKEHYLCNACASKESINKIYQFMFDYKDQNPSDIAEKLIAKCGICGNSPHPLTTAAFLVAYRNLTSLISEEEVLDGVMRAAQIPGGWCGYYGTCGAAVGIGVAYAVIQKATPMSDYQRSVSNVITSEALKEVADLGGPRCCTSSVRASIDVGIAMADQYLHVKFPEKKLNMVRCWVSDVNNDCRKERCRYFSFKEVKEYGKLGIV